VVDRDGQGPPIEENICSCSDRFFVLDLGLILEVVLSPIESIWTIAMTYRAEQSVHVKVMSGYFSSGLRVTSGCMDLPVRINARSICSSTTYMLWLGTKGRRCGSGTCSKTMSRTSRGRLRKRDG
jgi:hypothetical protein